jgi:glucose/arabinose dehydrogenase
MPGRRLFAVLIAAAVAGACGSNDQPPTPSPGGPGNGDTITGRERIGWDQPAASVAELNTYRYAIYVDGARSEVAEVTCAATSGSAGFACTGRLPAMAPGARVLELAAFVDADGIVESPRSPPLTVTVTGATTPISEHPLAPGDVITTGDGVAFTALMVVEGLSDVMDIALSPGGALFAAERSGGVVVASADTAVPAFRAATSGPLLALTPAPDNGRSGHIFVVHDAGRQFRLTRYRLAGTQLIERMHVLPDVAAPADPAAALRSGPDGRLYLALDSGGDIDAAGRLSDWRGKILRLNPDGSTPDDQPAASPVFWQGLASPRALGWSASDVLWIAERGHDRVERLRAIASGEERPRRAGQRASYVLPGDVGAASIAFHHGAGAPRFAGNLLVAARDAACLLRVQFDETDRLRAVTTERLLEGRLGELRAVAVAADGGVYIATRNAVWRLAPVRDMRAGAAEPRHKGRAL